MKFRSLVASIAFGVLAIGSTFSYAEEAKKEVSIADWKGEYTTAESIWADARTDEFYKQIVEEAKKAGKQATLEGLRDTMTLRYYAPFAACTIDDTGIVYTLKDGSKTPKIEYDLFGTIKGKKGDWYYFVAKKVDARTANFKHLVVTVNHGDVKHFHFLMGNVSGYELWTNEDYKGWHGTCFEGKVDYDEYMKKLDAGRYVKFAL